jgi:uncharacterized protein
MGKSFLSIKLKEGYRLLFHQQWPDMVGGVLLGLLSILIVAWSRPWGIVGGMRNWADWVFYGIGIIPEAPEHPLFFSSSIMDIGLLLGAFAAALLAKEFALRTSPKLEIAKGFCGGILMGVGSSLAMGCNVGAFYTTLIHLSANGFTMMVGLIAGAYIGLRYLLWELEHFPAAPAAMTKPRENPNAFDWKTVQPYVGGVILLGMVVAACVYNRYDYTEIGGVLLFGVLFGIVLQRCRFCFVRAFRDPFMTGEATVAKAIVVSILIGTIGVSILKWNGFRPETLYVVPTFGWGSLLGGLIFGIGMVIAGGCGSGTLWRVAEGHLKLWMALLSFALTNSLMNMFLQGTGLKAKLGFSVFLPNIFGWQGALLAVALVLFLWYLVLSWNEETDKFTIGM